MFTFARVDAEILMASCLVYQVILCINPCSPLADLARLGLLHPDDLVAVEQAERVKCQLHLAHQIDGGIAKLVRKVVPLDQSDTVLALLRGCRRMLEKH